MAQRYCRPLYTQPAFQYQPCRPTQGCSLHFERFGLRDGLDSRGVFECFGLVLVSASYISFRTYKELQSYKSHICKAVFEQLIFISMVHNTTQTVVDNVPSAFNNVSESLWTIDSKYPVVSLGCSEWSFAALTIIFLSDSEV